MDPNNELLLLGLLDHESMHGYALNEFLEHRLGYVSTLKKPTAYRLLELLLDQGLVEQELEREGRRPERKVYRITELGRSRLVELLRSELARADRPVYGSNVPILFWEHLDPVEVATLLERRRADVAGQHIEMVSTIEAHSAGTPARLVLEHDLAHLETELVWLDRLIAEFRQQRASQPHLPDGAVEP
jgi:DNA-binding PadR family transcriptional regulator